MQEASATPPLRLPPLRQELTLRPAPAAPDGTPTWTLHDPAANRFYQIGWAAFEILSRWTLGEADAVVAAVNAQTTLRIDHDDVSSLLQFLSSHHLLMAAGAQDSEQLRQAARRHQLSVGKWLLKNYLFLRVPLVRPMPFLRRVSPWVGFVYRPAFWWLVGAVALLGLYLVSRQWEHFAHTFHAYTTWQGLLGLALALSFAKVVHEMGHALTAYRHGCKVPAMGVGLLVMWPVLFTDTSEAWKLPSRRQRLQIAMAGVLAELALAAFATLLWNVLPDGPLRAGVFMLATSTWVATLAINASPFTRFDGYYVLSDWWNVPNLHERAFALGRWWLREQLFGFGDPLPEVFPPRLQRKLIVFTLVTWVYRFVLFLSISLLVFHFFFRALGIVLMCVELGWFLGLPILRELQVWWRRRHGMHWNRRTVRTAVLAALLALWLFVPWQNAVRVPAVLERAQAQVVYAPRAAEVVQLKVHDGDMVHAGEVLLVLRSPELDYRLKAAGQQAARSKWELDQQPFNDDLRALGPALRKRWETAQQLVDGYRAEQQRLTLKAPFDGRVVDVDPALHQGGWLRGGEQVLGVIGDAGVKGEAFAGESDLARLRAGQRLRFVPRMLEAAELHCTVGGVDRLNLASLDEPYVASVYGGPISSLHRPDGTLVPLDSTFRVRFGHCDRDAYEPASELSGQAVITGESRSVAGRFLRWLTALLRREVSF
ncbi:HlyD family efflux transporter periplasmic adaptor subunit [Fulvimonas sp. R45]|uniref:efflux RND transporter periplasmic adaptor subunit n=1 Tax=Fulvimonas sp. R45 TaxID=3045937 RepID=UPI00265F5DE3|nr:HlyD family efflux transporter periplasmic adaptor subunit [Fulvimonas sp. R45]MDO1530358.1 HlyD family efflux transporter periplasmic adaptor subunit [Fulvimonas sp. R45]